MKNERLYTTQRRNEIVRILREQGSVSVNQLAERFGVSGTTIRLDLTALESEGAVSRTHGGALLSSLAEIEPLIPERRNDNEKNIIARKAVSFIDEHDTILVDTGTTMLALAKALVRSELTHITVYSNDLDVIRTLEEKSGFELHLLGGTIRNGFHYTFGDQLNTGLDNYHFKKLFLATSAISLEKGLTTANSDLAAIKSKMIAISDEILLLTDSSKMHHVAFRHFADLSSVDTLITDGGVSDNDAIALRQAVKNLVIAGE
jgi:DeoR/GlpR family transcriptional regulator of sugar metabolism